MDIYEAINGRRTMRDFEDRPIDINIIEKIIDAGLKAPTNDHMRSWKFVIVNDKNIRANIVKPSNFPILQNATTRKIRVAFYCENKEEIK